MCYPLILFILSMFNFNHPAVDAINEQTYEDLKGEWQIDLRPQPDADPYYETMIIKSEDAKSIKGTFYGSKIEEGLLDRNWELIYFAFSSRDASHTYYHSGYLKDGKLYGTSYCPTRNFVSPWTGTQLK